MRTFNLKFIVLFTAILFFFHLNIGYTQGCPEGYDCLYVSTTGNDNNPGTETQPYQTIQKAINQVSVENGTWINVLGGIYSEKLEFYKKKMGTFTKRIVLTSYNGRAIIDGGATINTTTPKPLIRIEDSDYVWISGITLQNNYGPKAEGIRIEGDGRFTEVHNCIIRNIGWSKSKTTAPQVYSNGNRNNNHNANPLRVIGSKSNAIKQLLIRDNEIYDCVTGFSESLTLVGNIDDFLVSRNKVHDNTNIGIVAAGHYSWVADWISSEAGPTGIQNQARNGRIEENEVYNCNTPTGIDQSAGIYVDGGTYIQVRRNKSYNNDVGFSIGCEECKSSDKKAFGNIVESNWAYNNKGAGLILGSAGTPVEDTKVFNNTFYKNYTVDNGDNIGVPEINLQGNINSQIKQNIIVPNRSDDYAVAQYGSFTTSNLQIDFNLFWQTSNPNKPIANFFYKEGGTLQYGGSGNNLITDPLFVSTNPNLLDLHIRSNSPAVNRGDSKFDSSVTNTAFHFVDIDKTPRIKGGRVDIGAHELR